jgi:hypothetical protein
MVSASTGYDASNAAFAWILLYGPFSAALGQLFALAMWWVKKPG